ncbi:MAG: ATP synthase F1 subunit gamma [Deltaproteobacteria bacterium HGW-Deltaproteobacteria-17]|nr:MAG: ATP synthase F1 subunit gamma [Deltaproteobacteria bacterium HGW-Deltaproteobacteria-17]
MQDLRTIKQRMGSIRNIRKIADAMKMVSTVKYWRLLEQLRKSRTISEEIKTFIPPNLLPSAPAAADDGVTLVLVFYPHRGMCGSLTQNLTQAIAQWYPEPENQRFAVFGKKGISALPAESFARLEQAPGLSTENLDHEAVIALSRFVAHGVTAGRFARVEAVVAEFHNMLRQKPERVTLVPLPEPEADRDVEVDLEPDPATLLQLFLPLYLECQLRRVVYECMVSEHAARMTAMDNASKNAQELLENFRLEYNKIRQSKITLELMEIISGSEAMQ